MRNLTLRLFVNLSAALFVGLVLMNLLFFFWGRNLIQEKYRLQLRALAFQAATDFILSPESIETRVQELQIEHNAKLLLISDTRVIGETLLTRELLPNVMQISNGYVVLSVWHTPIRVIAAKSLAQLADDTAVFQKQLFVALGGFAVITLFLALLLLRRAFVFPLRRITESVLHTDTDALDRLGEQTQNELSQLSRAILSMTRRIDDDRQHISNQFTELQTSHRELKLTQDQLVRSERLAVVGQLAAGLAHEIGNPLAILSGYLEIFSTKKLDAEGQESVGRMQKELQRIEQTVRHLLDLSRAERSANKSGNVHEAFEHVRQLITPHEKFRTHRLIFSQIPAHLLVGLDTQGLIQLLLNLLLNAADALTAPGQIVVTCETTADLIRIAVEDSGPGVDENLRDKIFEPFFTTKSAGKGTGLGLAVCEQLVTAAGGKLRVEKSAQLGGAAFVIFLPVAKSPEQ